MSSVMIICMWCEEVIGEKDDEGSGITMTNGCCNPCLKEHYPECADEIILVQELREATEEQNKRLVA